MADSSLNCGQSASLGARIPRAQVATLVSACALVVVTYVWTAKSGILESSVLNAADTYYNLLVQGLCSGQLHLKCDVPHDLTQLADPHDPRANALYRMLMPERLPLGEMSYYEGKLFLYYGVTPAFLLFWPWYELTGHFLLHNDAVAVFFSVGFGASVSLLCALWRRCFPEIRFAVVLTVTVAMGLVNFTPVILQRCDVYEVAISCGYVCTMLTLVVIWKALTKLGTGKWELGKGDAALGVPRSAWVWLAVASFTYGLALGARPSLLFGGAMLLVPVLAARCSRQRTRLLWLAAVGPIALVGAALMFYNYLRFGNPLEFGQRYQFAPIPQDAIDQFSLRYLWPNIQVAFWAPARWSSHFPFVRGVVAPHLPEGANIEYAFGVFPNAPWPIFDSRKSLPLPRKQVKKSLLSCWHYIFYFSAISSL